MNEGLRKWNDEVIEKLKGFVKLAKEVVKDEEDEVIKVESFKLILNKMIEYEFTKSAKEATTNKVNQENVDDFTNKQIELAELCLISVQELNDVFKFKDDSFDIIAPIEGNDALKRNIASQCYLAASEICYSKDWVDSVELAECMRSMGLKDMSNLSKQLKRWSEIFRSTGTRGHNKYKLTSGIGRKSAFELIRKLAKGEKIEN
ncbi:MAG: hypothetical protein OER82_12450 [Nitrosopumilus sp.]|nr:hypothetical protein [Nitrosopumilus sp.]